MTVKQTRALAALEQLHARLIRLPEDSGLGSDLLSRCNRQSRAYLCLECQVAFTINLIGNVARYDVRFAKGTPT